MKKILSAIIVIAMIASLLSTNVVFAQSYNGVTYPNPITDYSPMNIREAASATSTKIGQVDMFEPIKILGREGDFFKVIAYCTDLQEKTGYLSAGFVKELSTQFTVHGENDVEVRSFADGNSYKKHNIKANTNINVCFELNGWYYFLNDSINSSNLNSGGFIRKDSVVNGEYVPPHIHSFTTKTEVAHPHREYKECACGEKEYTGNTTKVDNCEECYPKTDIVTEPNIEPTLPTEPITEKKEETNIPTVSTMKINGFSLPEKHTDGTKFDFEGNISSNTNISSVTVTIKPYSTQAITKTLTSNGKTFNLSQFTKYFDFTKFDDLAYAITISATDELKTADVFTGTFVLQTDEKAIDVDTVFNNSLIYEFGSAVVFNNGKVFEMDAPMEMDTICNRTMIPIKALEWFYNGTVSWNKAENCAQAVIGDKTIKLKENEKYMTVNGNKVDMDAAMYVKYDRTYVPLRAISELLGKNVYHIGGNNPVVITDFKLDSALQNEIVSYAKKTFITAKKPSNITISGFSVPDKLTYGKAYGVGGTVTSVNPLVKVYIQICGEGGFNYAKEGNLGTTFDMATIDDYITFNTLSPGDKHLMIYAKDNIGSSLLIYDTRFTVEGGTNGNLMLWPVPSSNRITTIFYCTNSACHSCTGGAGGHKAIDIAAPNGNAVVAAASGTVISAFSSCTHTGCNCGGGWGNNIKIDHGNGIVTEYHHLESVYVTSGDTVYAGQQIGTIGNTGQSQGNHLDFMIKQNGTKVDPLYYVNIPEDAYCTMWCDKPYLQAAKQTQGK